MLEPLLRTKLFVPPPRPNLVPRPQLIQRLNQSRQLGHKLALVSAPAGFGKTTLVREWVGALSRDDGKESTTANRVGWLSLDENDNDPKRFLTYLITALNQREGIETPIGQGSLDMLRSPQPPAAESVLTSLINEITAIPDRIVLVLDDYHLIDSSPVDDAITFLIERLPPHLYLVIVTRIDPNFPLARLRARGQLTELRATDLRFTSSEAAEFLNQVMGLSLSAEDISALESRTEGWIAGLQMAALALQGPILMQRNEDASGFIRSFTGSHRYVLDYLVEEVLGQQTDDVQTFLLKTAVLDRLTGPLCDALSGQNDSQATLEMLEHANLFIVPLDEERRWYRYHHLFADLLRRRLRQKQPDWAHTLYQQASAWCQDHGFVEEAIAYALRAKDVERAAYLIEEQADAICHCGEQTELRDWIAGLPAEWVFTKPQLCLCHAWNLFTDGQHDAADRSLEAVENALDLNPYPATDTTLREEGQSPMSDRTKLRRRVAAIRGFVASYRSDAPTIIQHAGRVLEYLTEQDSTWRSSAFVAVGDAYTLNGELAAAHRVRLDALEASKATGSTYITLIASLKLAMTMIQQGQLGQAVEICQQQLQLANESGLGETSVVGCLLSIWGWVLAELNDLEAALRQAKQGVDLAERGSDVEMIGWSNLCLARILFSKGEMVGAQQIVERMESLARQFTVPPWITNQIGAWQARLWLAQDKLALASHWVERRALDLEEELVYAGGIEYGAMARILIAQGRLDEANALLKRVYDSVKAGKHTTREIETLLLQALAFEAEGDTAQALAKLEQALTRAEPAGFIRIFADEGPPMARLLLAILANGVAPGYIRRLLTAFAESEPEQAIPSEFQTSEFEMMEPLSERELEVIQLIAEGLTNREIASRLFLSLNTVKAHTRNIYGKLDIHNRTQAVGKARALGILPCT